MDPLLQESTSRAIEQNQQRHEGWRYSTMLQKHAPHERSTEEQLAAVMVGLRGCGVDVLAGAREAQRRIAELGLDVDVPIQNTRPTPLLPFRLSDTGRTEKED